ncbi:hypothetical protein EV384_5217 [Micromonospora kangleipakensis]|uniref:Uncharacterized protein n=1 Tax=Micromonospora kangleipakensis TaxID=1077942 RepID=A0A4Q8BGI9_9ACTN|nr:hypothetical protein EV384_5217 [Micromonospora kangleipakensis]
MGQVRLLWSRVYSGRVYRSARDGPFIFHADTWREALNANAR